MDARLDKFGALVSQSKVAVAILSTPALGRFELADLESLSTERMAHLGMELVGVIGMIPDRDSVVGLTPRVALAVELDDATIAMLTERFVRLMQKAVAHIERVYLPTIRTMEAN
jgi:hypothetical protein